MTTLQRSIQVGTDDAKEALGDPPLLGGNILLTTVGHHAGFRFQNIQIPQDARVDSAVLSLVVANTDKQDAEGTWSCQDADDTATFTTTDGDIDGRPKTTASVAWTDNDLGGTGTVVETPDLAACVQEVIDRGGWAAGNSVVFLYVHDSTTDLLSIVAFESENFDEASLTVEWTYLDPNAVEIVHQERFELSHQEGFALTHQENFRTTHREQR